VTFQAKPPFAGTDPKPDFDNDVLALRPALHAFARRLARQEPDRDDLVQDTILKALAARDHFTEGTNLKAWLFTIMRNSFITRWRKSQRETLPAAQVDRLWARQAIDCLLHDLSPAHREILILIPVLGLAYEEAAEICGCSVGTVKSRLFRARAVLATLVDGEGDPGQDP
jgi:RNA polymerase sigma-70 factor (ECF subfamily)